MTTSSQPRKQSKTWTPRIWVLLRLRCSTRKIKLKPRIHVLSAKGQGTGQLIAPRIKISIQSANAVAKWDTASQSVVLGCQRAKRTEESNESVENASVITVITEIT